MISFFVKYKNIFLILTVAMFIGSLGFVGAGVFMEEYGPNSAIAKVGETKIELLEPTCPESTIAKFIENKGAGVHHVAFAVEDGVANALAEAEGKEIRLIDKAPRKGAEGLNIAFLHPKSTLGVLTELCEH